MSVQSKPNYQPICALLLCAAVAFTGCGREKPAHAAPPPEVQVIPVRRQDVPVIREWVATMDGAVNAQVRAQVTGYLLRQRYRNGEFVRKGAQLFDIDARPFQAVVNEAQANVEQSTSRLAQAQSDLASAQAKLGKTRLDVARSRPLAQEKAISQQELDDAIQSDLAAQAAVSSAEAGIVAAKAAIEGAKAKLLSAQLNLNFATIVSPIDGIAGRANYFEVLEAQQQLFPAENSLAVTETNRRVVVVQLYKALGGGWKLTGAQWTKPAQPGSGSVN